MDIKEANISGVFGTTATDEISKIKRLEMCGLVIDQNALTYLKKKAFNLESIRVKGAYINWKNLATTIVHDFLDFLASSDKYEMELDLTKDELLETGFIFTRFLDMIPDYITLSFTSSSKNTTMITMANKALTIGFQDARSITSQNFFGLIRKFALHGETIIF